MPQLSIIIPIYNTPVPILERCFASFDSLKGICFEVLLVDDGSEKVVGSYCTQYAEAHPAFRYLRKENGGVSSARNFGLDHAQGEYVMFVDADDTLMGSCVTPELFACDTDLVIFDIQLFRSDTEQVWYSLPRESGNISREDLLYYLLTGKSLNSPCVKLFRRAIIENNQLRFDTGFITGEDWIFVCSFVLKTSSAQYVRQCCYRYYLDDATSQSRITRYPDKILDNQLCRFARKEEIAASEAWTHYTKEQILSLASTELIENLFNTASELLLAKQYSPDRKSRIKQAVCHAGTYLHSTAPRKTRLKLLIVTRFPAALGAVAALRRLYLKLK